MSWLQRLGQKCRPSSLDFARDDMLRVTLLAVVGFVLLGILWPLPASISHPEPNHPVRIEDRNGKLLYEYRKESTGSKQAVLLSEIPSTVIDALIAIEDRNFYKHPGIHIPSIVRALWQNLSAGEVISGASTITQQLVRNRLQPERRTVVYKAREALYALKLEWHFSKNEILEQYLNTAYFGHQAYGIQAASEIYFHKSPHELSIGESALLIGLLQSPSVLDPYTNISKAKERRERVLQALWDEGRVTEEQFTTAVDEPIALGSSRTEIEAPHFVFWTLEERSDAIKNATAVRTTLDLDLQLEVERIIENNLSRLADKNVTSAAVVVLDARTGDVLSMVGSADYWDIDHDGAVNVATSARQPGSALKPFTYALAFMRGATPATTVADIETQFFTQDGNPYIPRNYDYGYHGLVRYREALANSYNIAAVKVLERIGVSSLLAFLKSAGITTLTESPEHYGVALTLGDGEVTLLELAQAYGMFPRGGETLPIRILESDPPVSGSNILDPKIAWLISDILSDQEARLPEFGADSPLNFDFPVAAKTGTTRNSRDNWTIGYTPDVIVGVWVGNADNTPMIETSGVTGAGPIFHDVMVRSMRGKGRSNFERPPGILQKEICRLSGKLPTPLCPETVLEYFIAGTEPKSPDDIYQSIRIDRRNGLLAGESCDRSFVVEQTYAVFPPELRTWARENGWKIPPPQFSSLCPSSSSPSSTFSSKEGGRLQIVRPNINDSFKLDPLIPDEHETVIFKANADDSIETVQWLVDGVVVGEGKRPEFRFEWVEKPGKHVIEARAEDYTDARTIEVLP